MFTQDKTTKITKNPAMAGLVSVGFLMLMNC